MSKHFNEAVEGDDGGLVICRGCKAPGTYAEPPSGKCPTPYKSETILLAESMAREQALQQRLNAADQRVDSLESGIKWESERNALLLASLTEAEDMLSVTSLEAGQRLTAAEQRNAELVELLDSAFFRLDTFIEAEREMPIPSMEVLRDAILRHCPDLKLTDSGASE